MGDIIFQIASDPAKEKDYQSNPVDLGKSTITLNVRHPEDFLNLACRLFFWRLRATGFIIEPA